jgi:hypothetical protein
MNRALITLLACILYCSATQASDLHKEVKVASGKTLQVDLNTGGDITIAGWDKEAVSVDVYFRGHDDEKCKVDVDETSSGVSVSSRYTGRGRNHSTSLRFEISVPKKFNLDLDSKGGDFNISGVEGELEGITMGGAMEFTALKGKINFHTMGGKITLTKSEVDGEVKTNGGKVFLEDVVGNVNGHSMGGAVTYRNVTDRSGSSSGEVERISSMGGAINVSDAPHGAEVSTMGGDIDVHSAAQFVKAKTMGGDINIDNIDGWVRAETMGGDVHVTMVGNPSEGKRDVTISSKGGDITLTVPPGLSMDVDITLAYTDQHWFGRDNNAIHSDFDIKEERTSDWDYSEGSRRKYIYGTGTINGGKHKIRIETINGNVYLKKGK